ncbi:hypothetical protein K3495_g3165 [Podosphaera aphanis]|nr:hypothetical protein K3495_g3165 [Podosphaera aphanis]
MTEDSPSGTRATRRRGRNIARKSGKALLLEPTGNNFERDVFEIAKWHKSKGTFRTPPLKEPLNPEAPSAESIEDKRNVPARNLLSNQSEVEDITTTTPTVATTSLPFPPLASDEVSQSILEAGKATPGKDEIPTGVLRLAWPHISVLVQNLYQACLDMGHHPKCFRTAIVAMIGKPNKTDMASPRSYRPIVLLSVIGKGPERLVAKRMSWVAIKYNILARQQFGALPKPSSVDLTTYLTHDVETALARGLTATMATLDIKGAFDAVLPGRLVRRMREQVHHILPVYRTTPIAALLRETGLNSAEVALDDISRRAAIRTRRPDPRHPLFTREQKSLNGIALTLFARTCRNIPASENNNPLLNPPWETVESRQNSLARICGPTGTKEFHANMFRTFLSTLLKSDIQVYSDGSKLPDGNAGGGYVIYQFGIQVCAKVFPLGKHKEPYDAEIRAAQQGIHAAVAVPSARFSNNLWIFIDNEEVPRKILTNTPATSSQQAFLEALEAPKI